VTEEEIAQNRALVEKYRQDPVAFARMQADASRKLAAMPVMSKGVSAGRSSWLDRVRGIFGR
jgi:hypothetical protein